MKHFPKYFAVLLVFAIACGEDENRTPETGRDYFPLRKGFYQIYNVESTTYSELGDPVTSQYQMLVEVADSFPSTTADYTYVIHRSVRDNETEQWSAFDTWSARINNRELIVNEGNTPYLKLIFPIREGLEWNGNKYNTAQPDGFEVRDYESSFELEEGTTFDNTLSVIQEDNEDYILFLDRRTEVYAKNVGLIYKEITQLHYCEEDNCRGQEIVESGVVYKQSLVEYGVE